MIISTPLNTIDEGAVEIAAARSYVYEAFEKDIVAIGWENESEETRERWRKSIRLAVRSYLKAGGGQKFQLGDRVTKIKGSQWTGRVVGFYSTELTPIGYAIESETECGSVQIYPEAALRFLACLSMEGKKHGR